MMKIIYDKSDIGPGSQVILKPEAFKIYKIPEEYRGKKIYIISDNGDNTYELGNIHNVKIHKKHFKPLIYNLHVYKFFDAFVVSFADQGCLDSFLFDFIVNRCLEINRKLLRRIDFSGRWDGSSEKVTFKLVENILIKSRNPCTRIIKNYLHPEYEIFSY